MANERKEAKNREILSKGLTLFSVGEAMIV